VLLGGAGILMALVLGREILTLIYRPEYAEHSDLFVLVMVAAGFGYVAWFLGDAMTAARHLRAQVPLFAVVAGSTALASFWLLPSVGLRGAAIALIISAIVQVIGSLFIVLYASRRLPRQTKENDRNGG
jgi:O-antigen/teichoic acid export membrane protein